jgi:hypothetical protein
MTALTDWLFDKTPGETDDAPPSPHVSGRPLVSDDEEWLEPPADEYDLEEVFTVIDYRDAKGQPSRRRITMRTLSRGPTAPLLHAICHERRAIRCFRTDRIDGFIEDTGEVLDCAAFFREILSIDLAAIAPKRPAPQPKIHTALSVARGFRSELRAPLSVLVALARSDDRFQPEELDVICRFVETIAPNVHDPAHPGEVSTMTELRPMIRRMRPTRESLPGCMADVQPQLHAPLFRNAFETAVNDVLWADGKITPGEQGLLAELGFVAEEH